MTLTQKEHGEIKSRNAPLHLAHYLQFDPKQMVNLMAKKKPIGKYAQVHESEWHTTFTPIADDYGCITLAVYFYLLSTPARNMTGIYRFNIRHAATDLNLDEEELLSCLNSLAESGRIEFDNETREIFVKDMLRTQADDVRPDSSDNRAEAVRKWLYSVESEILYDSFINHNKWDY